MSEKTLLGRGAESARELLPDINQSLSNINRTVKSLPLPLFINGRQQFSRQRKMMTSDLVGHVRLQKTMEDYLSPLGMTQVISRRLGIPQQKGVTLSSPTITYTGLQQALDDAHLEVEEAMKIIKNRLDASKLIEWSKLRRVIEDHISINDVIKRIKSRVGSAIEIQWATLKSVLEDYISDHETQKLVDDFLALREREQIQTKLQKALENHVNDDERGMIERQLATFKRMAWPELRELLKDYVREDEIKSIAMNFMVGSTVEWPIIEVLLKKHLRVNSLMKMIARKFTIGVIQLGAQKGLVTRNVGQNRRPPALSLDKLHSDLPESSFGDDYVDSPSLADQFAMGTGLGHRTKLAAQIVTYAEQNYLLPQLEDQMRFINAEALYYL